MRLRILMFNFELFVDANTDSVVAAVLLEDKVTTEEKQGRRC